jgi:hypothetical protein
MGGGGAPSPPAVTAPVPSAADEAAAAERARLYSRLRSRRGQRGLGFGPPRRLSLLNAATTTATPTRSSPFTAPAGVMEYGGGSGGTGPGDGGMGGGVAEGGGGHSGPDSW